MRLAGLYGTALNVDGSSPSATAYAAHVRKTLDASRDASLLAGVASSLLTRFDRVSTNPDARRQAIGTHYLNRAFEIDPRNRQAHYVRRNIAMNERALAIVAGKGTPAADPARPVEADGSSLLACFAEQEYMRRNFTPARAFAEQALRVAPTLTPERSSCDAEFRANLVLASIEFTEGRRAGAVDYLLAASRAPSPMLPIDARAFPAPYEGRLLNTMLKHGERRSIIEYLERSAASRPPSDAERMRKEAAAIRAGRMPERYQRALFEGSL